MRTRCIGALRALAAVALLVAASATPARELRAFDAGSLKTILAEKAGHPFVLALWSITCAPCLQDMDDWIDLQAKYPRVTIVLVATDGPADRQRVMRIVARYRLGRIETWGFEDEFTERVRHAIDRTWRGELPRTYFYDAAHQRQVHTGRIDRSWTEQWFARQQ